MLFFLIFFFICYEAGYAKPKSVGDFVICAVNLTRKTLVAAILCDNAAYLLRTHFKGASSPRSDFQSLAEVQSLLAS